VDTSDEFALYLFRAGQYHADDGPRGIDVPPAHVTASVGLVLAGFGEVLRYAGLQTEAVARAIAAWSKFLTIQLDLMLLGYRFARDLHTGPSAIRCRYDGRLRPIAAATLVHVGAPASVGDVVLKIASYYPLIRDEAPDCEWEARTPGRVCGRKTYPSTSRATVVHFVVHSQGVQLWATTIANEPDGGDGNPIPREGLAYIAHQLATRVAADGVKLYGPDTADSQTALRYLPPLLDDPVVVANLAFVGVQQY
jgi:hypothetical protein